MWKIRFRIKVHSSNNRIDKTISLRDTYLVLYSSTLLRAIVKKAVQLLQKRWIPEVPQTKEIAQTRIPIINHRQDDRVTE